MKQVGGNKQMHYYRLSPDDVLKQVHSSAKGLGAHEAAERFVAYLRQFRDLMIALLMGSALLSLYLGDIRTSVVLMALVFFNTTIGFLQEFKAEKLIESLEKLVVAKAKVLRGGKELEIASSELVVGDVVRIEAGDNVPTCAFCARKNSAPTTSHSPAKVTQPASSNTPLQPMFPSPRGKTLRSWEPRLQLVRVTAWLWRPACIQSLGGLPNSVPIRAKCSAPCSAK